MKVAIKTDYIKLDQLLKHAAVASTGGEAKALIKEGMVSLNGETATQRGKKIYPGDRLTVLDQEIEVVSA
jgi:ribosome-associated protein